MNVKSEQVRINSDPSPPARQLLQPTRPRRFSISFSEDAYDGLEKLAARRGKSLNDIIRDAITLEQWVTDVVDQGGQLILKNANGTQQIVLLR